MEESKEEIVKQLKTLLGLTRAGKEIADLVLHGEQEKITILFRTGQTREVNISCDSGLAIIKDVCRALG